MKKSAPKRMMKSAPKQLPCPQSFFPRLFLFERGGKAEIRPQRSFDEPLCFPYDPENKAA